MFNVLFLYLEIVTLYTIISSGVLDKVYTGELNIAAIDDI